MYGRAFYTKRVTYQPNPAWNILESKIFFPQFLSFGYTMQIGLPDLLHLETLVDSLILSMEGLLLYKMMEYLLGVPTCHNY